MSHLPRPFLHSASENARRSPWLSLGVACLFALGASLPACQSPPEPEPAAPGPSPMDVVLGPRTGVDVRVVAVRDAGVRLAAALAPHEHAASTPALSAQAASDWARSGLRLVIMPEAEALALADTLVTHAPALAPGQVAGERTPVIAGARQQMILQGPAWSEVVRGPVLPRRTMGLHDARVQTGPGPLRLLGRCWAVPDPRASSPDAAAIRLQLVPQAFEGRSRTPAPGALEPAGAAPPQDQGLTFWRLRTELTLAPGEAAVIIGEAPGVSWRSGAREAEAEPAPPPPARPAPPPPGRVVRALADTSTPPTGAQPAAAPVRDTLFGPDGTLPDGGGPWSGVVRTLGEEMLCLPGDRDEDRTGRGETRLIVVIVARPPPTFTLIAPPGPQRTSPPGP